MKKLYTRGELYSNGESKTFDLIDDERGTTASEIRVKAYGSGTCKVTGKLRGTDASIVLSGVALSDLSVKDTITDNDIYAFDVTGLDSVSVSNVSGFTSVWATVVV